MPLNTSRLFAAAGSTLALCSAAALAAEPSNPVNAPALDTQGSDYAATTLAAVNDTGADSRFGIFTPTADPIRHRFDFEAWDWILKNVVISMGPSDRTRAPIAQQEVGTRIRQGHNSPYRLEGSMVIFNFLTPDAANTFGEYRMDLERISGELDIAALPRNEQLAFWFNLHNAAMLEALAREWPVRQPREIMVDGVPLDDAKFLTVRGIAMSLRDIRENIVFANWRDPKVIYGFWRGEIGGPALEREAYTGANVNSLLDIAAQDFVNSLRGIQQRGDRMEVSRLYEDAAPYYFADFDTDLRAHLGKYAEADVGEILADTQVTRASISEWDIADLTGGARPANYLFNGSNVNPMFNDTTPTGRVPLTMWQYLTERRRKLERMQRRDMPTGRVIFSNIDLPGDPPNKNAVE